MAGRIAATLALLVYAARMHWLGSAGLARLGDGRVWAITALAIAYLAPGYLFAMFGMRGMGLLADVPPNALLQVAGVQATVGIAEETLFRGVLLAILVEAWGRTRTGALRAVVATAAVFAVLHSTAAFAGVEIGYVLANLVAAFVSGAFYAALVLRFRTIWPVVVIHAVTNAVVLAIPVAASPTAPLWVALVEGPWLAFGVWLLLDARSFPPLSDAVQELQHPPGQQGGGIGVIGRE